MSILARGIRNNNPGNIRHDKQRWREEIKGTDTAFKTFSKMEWGIRAIFHLINNYRLLHKCDTVKKIISRYAPPNENHTQAYIDFVCSRLKTDEDTVLDTTDINIMMPFIKAIIVKENGLKYENYIQEKDYLCGWEHFLKYRRS